MADTNQPPELEIGKKLVHDILDPMKQAFVGKDEIIDLLGVCLVAGEHLFLLGPPGTAKSALVHDLSQRLAGQDFSYLLTRFTEPSELFGPFDIRRLREGELVTNTEGMLPEASLVFLDELLNANSAILNSLLMVLNERVFRRGRETRTLPLLMVIGASNHLPEDDALGALFDRFLARVRCDNVDEDRLTEVMNAGWKLESRATVDSALHVDDVRKLNAMLPSVDLTAVQSRFVELVQRIRRAGIQVSDRRAVKLQRLVAASALLCGRLAADTSDLWIFRYIWDTAEQQEVLASLVTDAIGEIDDSVVTHPRARGDDRPDPEALARDLDGIESALARAGEDPVERARLRDRLGLLAGRCEWIGSESERAHLLERVEVLWSRFETS